MREWISEKEEGVGEKVNLCPFIRAEEAMILPAWLAKTAYSPGTVIDGAIGLPTTILMRIP